MPKPPTPSRCIRRLVLTASLALIAGCGGSPHEVDTAETIPPESAKPAPTPATAPPVEVTPTPEAPPVKEAPKG